MTIWIAEIKELEKLYESLKGRFTELEKELEQLIKTQDANVVMLYSRRCLEIIVTELCENELKRPRKTEPLKGIIDKLHKEEKVPSHIISSMYGLNELSTYGTHPKDFDPEQVKPVLVNLDIIIKWFLKYKNTGIDIEPKSDDEIRHEIKDPEEAKKSILIPKKSLTVVLSGFIVLIVIVFVILFLTNIIGSGKKTREIEKSIAVLPFKNDSPDLSTTYFIDGVMEEILTNLQTIKDIRVISRTSAEQYRDLSKASTPEIAKKLGVNYIVEGSGQKYGNKFRLRVQLIRAAKENHLWAKSYEREINTVNDIFGIQSQVAESIATELEAVITPNEKQLIEKTPTSNLAAYEDYLQGMSYWYKFNKQDWEVALQYFEKAKEKDPRYALAYSGICEIWIIRGLYAITTPEVAAQKAIAAFTKAFELDSTSAEVYLCLEQIQSLIKYDWKGAESSIKKAIALNPNNVEVRLCYADLLTIEGLFDEAIEQSELAKKLDPLNPTCKGAPGLYFLFARRYNDAITLFQEVLKIDPTHLTALTNLPIALHQVGRYKEALDAWKSAFSICYNNIGHAFDLGYAKGGYAAALNLEADTLVAQSKTNYILPSDIALLYACAGNKQRAMDMLERDYMMHGFDVPLYLNFPVFEGLRNDSRFQEIARKLNLPYK